MYSCLADVGGAVIQITNEDGPMDPITVTPLAAFTDGSSDPPRQVIMGPMTIEITGASNFIISWFEP